MSERQPSNEQPFTNRDSADLEAMLQREEVPTAPDLTPDEIDRWIRQSDGILDQTVNLRGEGGDEPVTVLDALYAVRMEPGEWQDTRERRPIVQIEHANQQKEELPLMEFLQRTGFDIDAFRERELRSSLDEAARRRVKEARDDIRYATGNKERLRFERERAEWVFSPDGPDSIESAHPVTQATHAYAVETLRGAESNDEDVAAIMRDYASRHAGLEGNYPAQVDAVHSDPGLRVALGLHFLHKINSIPGDRLPSRVLHNEEKSPNFAGKAKKMRSREYVALLGVRMLDGSYDPSAEMSADDGIELDDRGVPTVGQHRGVARMLFSKMPSPRSYQPRHKRRE